MHRRRLLWHLFPTYILVIVSVIVAVTWVNLDILRADNVDRTSGELQTCAQLLAPQALSALTGSDPNAAARLCAELSQRTTTRVTLILPSGLVVGDSSQDPRLMENHANRPEVRQALAGLPGHASRFSATLHIEMLYVALPLYDRGKIVGVVRTAMPLLALRNPLGPVAKKVMLAGGIIAVLAMLLSLLVSQGISRPIEALRNGALSFAGGDLRQKLRISSTEEIGSLAEAMNLMAAQLDARINVITRQRNEQDAILSSMMEGVLAVDMDERLISMNLAAERMLQISQEKSVGRVIQEVIRNADLQAFVGRVLANLAPIEGDIALRDGSERFLQASGAILHDAGGRVIGAVVVLNDVTRIRRLENMRRDFVANVSHELRTPITSIKGFVETLIDGALHDREDAEHFLQVIAKQVDRLNVIIEDLLLLSTVEQNTERADIGMEEGSIAEVLVTAMQVCGMKADAKEIALHLDCPELLCLRVNPPLLEQAIVNLIDNAIKYSDPGGHVRVHAEQQGEEVVINVADSGCGIGPEHLPRLFERFYRVDKARSRKLGGTGLGLAIVKHIAQAHGGSVSVASTLGAGSVFSIHLPRNGHTN